jgi:hypothetical protein
MMAMALASGGNQPECGDWRAGRRRGEQDTQERTTQGRKTFGSLTAGWLLLFVLLLLLLFGAARANCWMVRVPEWYRVPWEVGCCSDGGCSGEVFVLGTMWKGGLANTAMLGGWLVLLVGWFSDR